MDHPDLGIHTGLRYLARLVYQGLKKKKLSTQNEIVEFVLAYLAIRQRRPRVHIYF